MTFETLHNDMVAAMKARDKARKGVLSTLIADVKKAAIDAGNREDIPEALVDQVILKSKKTAREQLDTIKALDERYGLFNLPEVLQQTAMLRIANPEASLAEFAELAWPPVSKSCMSHRIKKLLNYREE